MYVCVSACVHFVGLSPTTHSYFLFKNSWLVCLRFPKWRSGKSWERRGETANVVWENLSGDSQHEPAKCSLQGWQPATARGQNVGAEPKRGKRSVNSGGECRGNPSVAAEVGYKKTSDSRARCGRRAAILERQLRKGPDPGDGSELAARAPALALATRGGSLEGREDGELVLGATAANKSARSGEPSLGKRAAGPAIIPMSFAT